MKLHGVPISVHTRKVLLAARLKGVPLELAVTIPVVPETMPADWRQISPTGLVPALDDDGFVLADSTAIVHYLERRYPAPPLLPADDHAFGEALFLDAWAGAFFRDVVHPIFHNQVVNPNIRRIPANPAAIEAAVDRAQAAFAYLDGRATEAFLVGAGLTIADLAVLSNLIMYRYLGRPFAPRFKRLQAYFQRHIDSDLFRATLAEETPFAQQMGLDGGFIAG